MLTPDAPLYVKPRIDPVLWTLSRDFVGDTAETASLLWPAPDEHPAVVVLQLDVVMGLSPVVSKKQHPRSTFHSTDKARAACEKTWAT